MKPTRRNPLVALGASSRLLALGLFSCMSFGCQGALEATSPEDEQDTPTPPGQDDPIKGVDASADLKGEAPDDDPDRPDGGALEDGGDTEKPECEDAQSFFEQEAWPVAKFECLGCHIEGGSAPAAGSRFVLWDEGMLGERPDLSLDDFFAHNKAQFEGFLGTGPRATFVHKALGELGHGGQQRLQEGSDELATLEELADWLRDKDAPVCDRGGSEGSAEEILLWRDVAQTYRKATVLFAGRLPTQAEGRAIEQAQSEELAWAEVDRLLEGLFDEDAFEYWITYAWNEIFMFRGLLEFEANFPHQIISKDFGANNWVTMRELSDNKLKDGSIACDDDHQNWQRFGYLNAEMCGSPSVRMFMAMRLGWSLAEGPLRLISWIVKQDRPFTEILTTEKVAMNYYSSLSYYGSGEASDNPFVAAHGDQVPIEQVDIRAQGNWEKIPLPEMDHFRVMDSVRRTDGYCQGDCNKPYNGARQTGWKLKEDGIAEYPRAGLLTSQIFLNRYPNTDTNVNRHRSWAFYDLFLGVDILELAEQRGDPAQAELESERPVVENANCNVCHNVMDPVAGMFQDFNRQQGLWEPEAEWPPPLRPRGDKPQMLPAGFGTVGLLANQEYDAARDGDSPLRALAEVTVEDPRFARRMVEHAFYQVIGRYPMELDASKEGAQGRGLRRAFEQEREYLNEATEAFVSSDYSMRTLLRHLVRSPFFRARGVKPDARPDEATRAELEMWGSGQWTPLELLTRRIEAGLGRPWYLGDRFYQEDNFKNLLDDPYNDYLFRVRDTEKHASRVDTNLTGFYGGIEFYIYTQRLRTPSSTMSSMAQRIVNEVTCLAVPQEFALPSGERLLFADVEADQTPATHQAEIRATIARLHERFLGTHRMSQAELDASYELFVQVQSEGASKINEGSVSSSLPEPCVARRSQLDVPSSFTRVEEDDQYVIRAYMAVLTTLMLDFEFLHDF